MRSPNAWPRKESRSPTVASPDTDHGFTHFKPVETTREAITMMGDHLLANLAER
jgi:hypothetical protein